MTIDFAPSEMVQNNKKNIKNTLDFTLILAYNILKDKERGSPQ